MTSDNKTKSRAGRSIARTAAIAMLALIGWTSGSAVEAYADDFSAQRACKSKVRAPTCAAVRDSDGKVYRSTYSNPACARASGARVLYRGKCKEEARGKR